MRLPQRDQLRRELQQLFLAIVQVPVIPADLIVLGIRVVVSLLRSPNSSPPQIIGTPCENSSVASKLRFSRSRSSMIAGSSVGPSTPWFQEWLSFAPSLLSSPLASLCFVL